MTDAARGRLLVRIALLGMIGLSIVAQVQRPSPGIVALILFAGSVLGLAAPLLTSRLPTPIREVSWAAALVLAAVALGLGATGAGLLAGIAAAALIGRSRHVVVAMAVFGSSLAALALTAWATDRWATAATGLWATSLGAVGGLFWRQQLARREAERVVTAERVRRAAAEERARIGRDLHDILAHSLGGLVLQLEALTALGEHTGARPELVRRLDAARSLAADGLVDAKRAVEALRILPEGLGPAINQVVDRARALGQSIDLECTGPAEAVPPASASVVASVLVEALGNAARHGSGTATVTLRCSAAGGVRLRVTNPLAPSEHPTARSLPSGRRGLEGMRERTTLVGGTLRAEPVAGEWLVECEVPA